MKKLLNSVVLLVVAVALAAALLPFGFAYSIYYAVRHYRNHSFAVYISSLFYSLALGIDKIGNVVLGALLNTIMLHKSSKAYLFGDINDTISYVLAKNLPLKQHGFRFKIKESKNLTWAGWWLVCILEALDNDHMNKSLRRRY